MESVFKELSGVSGGSENKLDTLTDDFLNTLYSSYFFPVIHKSTRVKENSATLIDNILTNSLSNLM